MKKIIINSLIVVISIYFAGLFVESGLFIQKKFFKKNLYKGDEKERSLLLKKPNSTVVIPTEHNSLNDKLRDIGMKYNFFPLGHSIPKKTIIYCDEGYGIIQYKSDRYGFNNIDENWDSTKNKILLIGDSFTHGACVNRSENLSGKISEYSGKKTINLGSDSNSIIHYLLHSEIFINKIKPDTIIYFLAANDLMHDYESLTYANSIYKKRSLKYFDQYSLPIENFEQYTKNYYLEVDEFLRNVEKKNFKKDNFFKRILKRIKLTLKLEETRFFLCSSIKCKDKINDNRKIFSTLIEKSILFSNVDKNKNIKIFFVLITNKNHILKYQPYLEHKQQFIDVFSNWKQKYDNIFLVDLSDYIDLNDQKLLPPISVSTKGKVNGHFSRFGYDQISKVIAKLIK